MYLITFIMNGKRNIGVLSEDKKSVIPMGKIFRNNAPQTMQSLIENFSEDYIEMFNRAARQMTGIDISGIEIEAPIPEPVRGIICLGKNYREHAREMANAVDQDPDIPKYPIYFSKLVDNAIGDYGLIPTHSDLTEELDYEAELGVIIGKEGRNIPPDKIEEHIFGYTIINDITARNLQKKHNQWFFGKSLDGSCPMGPYLVHKSTIGFPPRLEIKSFVNGELRQNSNTGELIFDIGYIISDLSKGMTLKPGDIIATGTPSGVGMGFKPYKFLKSGDSIDCYIEKIGTLHNKVK